MKYWLDTEFIAHPFMIDHAAFSSRSAVRLLQLSHSNVLYVLAPAMRPNFWGWN